MANEISGHHYVGDRSDGPEVADIDCVPAFGECDSWNQVMDVVSGDGYIMHGAT
jgi:hypothetical protein